MKVKKIIATAIAAASIAGLLSAPVMAELRTDYFNVYKNGGFVSSPVMRKLNDYNNLSYVIENRMSNSVRKWVKGVEKVNVIGNTSDGTKCTNLAQVTGPAVESLYYNPGYGIFGDYYKLSVQYDDSNPYDNLDLQCTWFS